jgi:hypothetical protein
VDQPSFDRITRLLGGGATRRQGLAAALAGVLGLAVPAAAPTVVAAGPEDEGNPGKEAKCLRGKAARKKRCRKHTQCCTGYCKKIKKRKNGKLRKIRRCRCAPEGFVCGAKTKCCGGMTCATGKCASNTPPKPGNPIPTGEACVAGVDTCADASATCVVYAGGNPAGTHCVLPVSSACTAASQCASYVCTAGTCAAPNPGKSVPTGDACVVGLDTCADASATCVVYAGGNPAGTHCVLPVSSACTAASQCASYVCTAGTCAAPNPGKSVPTGDACVVGLDTCADASATCVVYEGGNPAGTHCVLPVSSACTAAGECVSHVCTAGTCAARAICTVCSTCTYTTVQAAITALESAATMQTVSIASGEYIEDLSLIGKIALAACNGEAVTLRNATAGTRTIYFNAPNAELVLTDITVSAKQPFDVVDGGGGIDVSSNGKLTLGGTTAITGNFQTGGGGIRTTNGSQVVMNDSSTVSGNLSAHGTRGGGGVYLEDASTLEMNDDSSISDNDDGSPGGGGVFTNSNSAILTMNDRSKITGNTTTGDGGGVLLDADTSLVINSQDVRITGNTASDEGGGGYQRTGSSAPAGVTSTVFNGNTATTSCNNYWIKNGSNCFLT